MASVLEVTKVYRARLARREARVVAEMLRDWGRIEADLLARATAIGERIEQAALAGTPIEPVWLFQQERVEELLVQTRRQMALFSEKYAPYLTEQAKGAALDGAKLAAEQLRVATAFSTRLSVSAIEAIAGATRTGPVADLLASIDATGIFRDALVRGIARGANPRAVAREVGRAVNATKQRTLTIARTEMARAQRQATYDAYDALGVTQWQWLSARDATTCAACWAMDGTPFPAEQEVDDHPNGRCAIVPVVEGEPLAEVPSRDAAWSRLSESQKLRVLGPSRYDLVSKGQVGIGDLAVMRESGTWGTSIGVAPLRSLAS